MNTPVCHRVQGAWASREKAFRSLVLRLRRKVDAVPAPWVCFHGVFLHESGSTLVDAAWFAGAEGLLLPAGRCNGIEAELRTRAESRGIGLEFHTGR